MYGMLDVAQCVELTSVDNQAQIVLPSCLQDTTTASSGERASLSMATWLVGEHTHLLRVIYDLARAMLLRMTLMNTPTFGEHCKQCQKGACVFAQLLKLLFSALAHTEKQLGRMMTVLTFLSTTVYSTDG